MQGSMLILCSELRNKIHPALCTCIKEEEWNKCVGTAVSRQEGKGSEKGARKEIWPQDSLVWG